MKTLFLAALFTLSFTTTAVVAATAAENLYVQSKSAKIMTSPAFDSDVAGTVMRGEKLKVTKTARGWYKVTTGSITGWVNRVNVSKNEPKARVSPVKEADKTISKEARRRASALTSAVSARGLSEKERKRASSKDGPDYQSLEKLEEETKSIPDERVEKFNKTAK